MNWIFGRRPLLAGYSGRRSARGRGPLLALHLRLVFAYDGRKPGFRARVAEKHLAFWNSLI